MVSVLNLNWKSQCSCCLSPTRSNKQRQELNLYGHFIQMVGLLPNRRSCISFQASLFVTENKVRWGVWNSGKVRLKTSAFSPWAVSCAPGGHLSLPGTQWLRQCLDCCWSVVEHKRQSLWGRSQGGPHLPFLKQ